MKELSTSPSNSRKKTAGYSSNVLRRKRKQRQYDADDRQAAWDSLTTQEKLNSLAGRRGESKRQVVRLKTLLATETPVETTEPKAKKKKVVVKS